MESGKYVPRFEPPTYEETDSGWPHTIDKDPQEVAARPKTAWPGLGLRAREVATAFILVRPNSKRLR